MTDENKRLLDKVRSLWEILTDMNRMNRKSTKQFEKGHRRKNKYIARLETELTAEREKVKKLTEMVKDYES